MKLRQLYEGVGLIVPGVNTTHDVGPDAIKKQAAKLGLKVDKKGVPVYNMHKKAHKNSDPNTLFNLGMAESRKDITYTKPNLDSEWDEATRYEEFKKIGKDKWIELVNKGKVVEYNTKTVQKMSNTDAVNVKDFDNLDKDKQARALKQLEKGSIELPIVASYSDGHLELVGGNTRLTAVMKATGKGKVWQFDVPDGLVESRKEIWNEWKIMPQTIKPMGLVHKAGKGPNNRFDFKNKGNNKANEDETELSSASKIYVDMDGVLVDFFGPWTKMMGVSDWKEIKDVDAALQKIRDTSKPSNIPIVMLTAKSQEVDKVRALELGADDYLTKPIAFEELGARIKALIRRSHGLGAENSINISGLSINPSRHLVEAKNKHVELGVVEFKLLYFLMKNNGRYFDRQSLIDAIWGQLSEVDERTVDVSILRLRKALKQHNLDRLVKTKRGIGYGFSEINS